ncbi:MAG: histidine kinase [Lentimicrobium sp.]|nr:histidine kinase [Lentimicrobium sp.]
MRKFLILLFLLILNTAMYAQRPVFRHYSVNEGLPSSEVYDVIQDSKGYMWIATNMGVSRFDGREFRNFDTQDGLPENTVFEVYEDETGRIWFVGFPFQLSYFRNDSIIAYNYNSILRMIAGAGAIPVKKSFLVDKDDGVTFCFHGNSSIYSIDKNGFTNRLYSGKTNSALIQIIEKNGQLLLSLERGSGSTTLLSVQSSAFEASFMVERSMKFSFSQTMASKGVSNEIFFIQNDDLYVVMPEGKVEQKQFPFRLIWVSSGTDGNIWLGTDKNGILSLNPHELESETLNYLSGYSVSSFTEDTEGGKWFSTLENGIYYQPSEDFLTYTKEDGLTDNKIICIELFQNSLYLGANDNYINILKNGKLSSKKLSDINGYYISAIKSAGDSVLWIGSNHFMLKYDGISEKKITMKPWEQGTSNSEGRTTFSIRDIDFMDSGGVLLTEIDGLSIFENDRFIYNSSIDDNLKLRFETIAREPGSSFLLGASNGLWRLTGRRFEYLGLKHPLLKQRIADIVTLGDSKNYLIGTNGFGLIVNLNDSIRQITRLSGLTSGSVSSLFLNENDLWIGTNNGLNRIDIRNLNKPIIPVKIYKKEHGLISNEINKITGDSDFIYIATNEGLTVFDLKKEIPVEYAPPVYINGLRIMRIDTLISDNYKLAYNQNNITISYTGISFRDGGQLQYKYKLEGLDNDWLRTGNTEVEFAFLPPGNYKFIVYGINSQGIESSQPAVLKFKILLPYWRKWWFITLVLLAVAFGAWFFYYLRMSSVRKEHALQNDINWYRQQSLTRQMDPHFVFNTLNSIQSYIIKNDVLSSSQYLSKFAKLMRLILNNSQQQAVPLSDEINALTLYMELESLRFQQKFDFNIHIDPAVEIENIYIPAFLIQPFIENAIWHGIMKLKSKGVIRVNFTKNEDYLICTVEDNGIGRNKSREFKSNQEINKKSLGISIVESRLRLLNNFYGGNMNIQITDLYNDTQQPSGTRVTINLPIII